MAALREKLKAVLGLDTTEFDRGLNASGRRVKDFGETGRQGFAGLWSQMSGLGRLAMGGLGFGVAGVALGAVISTARDAAKSIATIGDEAKRSGLAVEAFQEWKYVAEQNRIGIDAVVDGFKELNLRADEFIETGSGSAADAFTRLGYSAADLRSKLKDPSALMLEIIGRLEGMDKAAQIRISDELFGGTGGEQFVQLLDRGQKAIRGTIQRGHELGAVMDAEVIEKAAEIDRKFTELTTSMSNWTKAAIVGMVAAGVELSDFRARLDEIFTDETEGRSVLGDGIYDALAGDRDALEAVAVDVEALQGQYQSLGAEASSVGQRMSALAAELDRMGVSAHAEAVRSYGDALDQVSRDYAQGTITADEFAQALRDIQSDADSAIGALSDVDGVSFDGVRQEAARFGTVIRGLTRLAQDLRKALPGSDPGMTTGTSIGAGSENMPPDPITFVRSSLRPEMRPDGATVDMDGDGIPDYFQPEEPASVGGSGKARQAASAFASRVQAIQNEVSALNTEAAALVAAAGAGREYSNVLDYARKKADLLTAAQEEGREITPELQAQIEDLARAYATASGEAEEIADRLRDLEVYSERGADAIVDIFMQVRSGAKTAKEAILDLIAQMAMVQAKKNLLDVAGSVFGGSTLATFGQLLGNANGTTNWRGGISLVGERGPELVSMPRGSQVFSATATSRMLDSADAGGHISIGFDQSTGGLTATMTDIAGRVVQQASSGIVSQAVRSTSAAARKSKSFFG